MSDTENQNDLSRDDYQQISVHLRSICAIMDLTGLSYMGAKRMVQQILFNTDKYSPNKVIEDTLIERIKKELNYKRADNLKTENHLMLEEDIEDYTTVILWEVERITRKDFIRDEFGKAS